MAEIVVLRGERQLLRLRLARAEVLIGRNPTADIVLPEPGVPLEAAQLSDRGAHRFHLRRLADSPLLVDGEPLEAEETDLGLGQSLTVGPFVLRLQARETTIKSDRPDSTEVREPSDDLGDAADGLAHVIHEGRRYPVPPERLFNIGGHADNDLVLDDAYVSAFHARIGKRNGRWFLWDLESTNGTEVNGLVALQSQLPNTATLRIGQAYLTFETTSSAGARSSTRPDALRDMIGVSAPMRRVFDLVHRLARAREPVLITGPSGSGKELVARALHDESPRSAAPFLALNCGALTHSLIESELFGHEKGAFTGATQAKAGAFEATDGGTLFLDEIGELPLDLQPRLLRVLESSTVRRVGGTSELNVDTRIVAATHRNLEELVAEGAFREDLFHRLFVLSIPIPPLAERPEDIVPLARHFLAEADTEPTRTLSADAEQALRDYTWPGNVRELRNVLVRAILMTDHAVLEPDDLVFSRDAFTSRSSDARRVVRDHDAQQRQRLLEALERAGGNRAEAARLLGVSKSTFHDRLKRYGIPPKHAQQR